MKRYALLSVFVTLMALVSCDTGGGDTDTGNTQTNTDGPKDVTWLGETINLTGTVQKEGVLDQYFDFGMLSASINKDDFTEYKVKVSPDNELVFNLGTPRTASMYTESFKLSSSLSFLPSHMRIFKCAIFMWSTYINLRCANSEGTFVFIYADNDGTITGVDDDGLSYDLKLKRGWNTALLSASKDTLKSYPLDHNAWIVKGESYYGF